MNRVLLALLAVLAASGTPAQTNLYLAPAQDGDALRATITATRPNRDPPAGVTGITVPHHLLAADLIARGFWAASAGTYDRIILIGPDHFDLVPRGFAVAQGALDTTFGNTRPAPVAAETLLAQPDLFTVHPDPMREHGIAALLPFVRHFFPQAEVLPIIASINTRPDDWQNAARALAPLVTPRTLVVQSTDYSHFLPVGQAALRDQQVLATILSGEPDKVARLHQPAHLDSKAAQFIQMHLQRDLDASVAVIANRNSIDYGTAPDSTTSYVVAVYHREPVALSQLDYPDQKRLVFGGDVLAGRFLLPVLQDANALAEILQTLWDLTRGAPLVVNLEGVIVPEHIPNASTDAHLMPQDLTLSLLDDLGVVAAGLANNHASDFGDAGLDATRAALAEAGIAALPHGGVIDLGPLRVIALNFLPGQDAFLSNPSELNDICAGPIRAPFVAFVHWGDEYTESPTEVEESLANQFAACGVSVLLGGHSHRADPQLRVASGQMQWTFSLGNMLYDQNENLATGQLAELRIFEQGTVAVRLVPLPNLFELGRNAAGLQPEGREIP